MVVVRRRPEEVEIVQVASDARLGPAWRQLVDRL
jgi:hypothetical protein